MKGLGEGGMGIPSDWVPGPEGAEIPEVGENWDERPRVPLEP